MKNKEFKRQEYFFEIFTLKFLLTVNTAQEDNRRD